MRSKVSLCLLEVLFLSLLVIGLPVGIPRVESQFFHYPDVTLHPSSPTTSDSINMTVSLFFASYPPYVEEFGPLTRDGNTFSIHMTVYVPTPWEVVLTIVHDDSYIYNLGNLSEGEYKFEVYVHHIHYTEGMVYLGANVNFHVAHASIVVPDDYLTIQEAINAVSDGDTVFVRNGTYIENVVVNKSISLLGEDRENTVVDGDGVGTVIQVDSDNVTISGFQIRGCSMAWGDHGIILKGSSKSVISGNIVKAVYAICVEEGSKNSIIDNDFVGDDGSCIFHGLQLVNSSSNVVNNNNLSVNCHYALTMYNSSNNFISFNYISGHFVPFPFTMEKSSNNSIVGNTMWQPAPLFGGHMHFTESKGNTLYHNSFLADEGPNTLSIDELSTNNTWDSGCEGNYWNNHSGIDTDNDGIGDTSYIIDGNNVDSYPLMSLYWKPADINHDLEVDIYDVVAACAAYTSTPMDPHWNCHCDISEPYGVIDIFDIVMICSNYGEEYTP